MPETGEPFEGLVMETEGPPDTVVGETLSESATEDVTDLESWTCALKDAVVAAVGVPEMVPEEAFSWRPAGSEPLLVLQV